MKMTSRQWKTYELIKRNSILGINTTQQDIVNNYPYIIGVEVKNIDGYRWTNGLKAHDKCPTIWSDINAINLADDIHKIIISPKPYEYRLAETEEEVKDYAYNTYFLPAMAKLSRYWNMVKKTQRDGQMKLNYDDSKIREYWETYIKEQE